MFVEAQTRIRARQLELRLQSAEVRAALAQDLAQLDGVWRVGDAALGGWRWLRDLRPLVRAGVWAGVSLLLARVLKRRRDPSGAQILWWPWAKTAWSLWRLWRRSRSARL
ncbi:MAG: hypothetical protein JO370_02365 [Paucibacter sp.]|nr:hypothetical protein [Roseateles sp.]